MNLKLKVWRQKNAKSPGRFELFEVSGISSEMSFLEMFDVLNEKLIHEGKDPIAFDHDCREGICGACSMYINGRPHGPWHANTTCVNWNITSGLYDAIKCIPIHHQIFNNRECIGSPWFNSDGISIFICPHMDKEGFGSCTNTGACEAVCPKEISITNIARLNAEYMKAGVTAE